MNSIIKTKKHSLNSRLVQNILSEPISDGGQWNMLVNIENKLPNDMPVLPLKYSRGSGFFFCGIIDDPVTILSFRFINLKASEFHIINSSAILEMWTLHAAQE